MALFIDDRGRTYVISEQQFKADRAELEAYRATRLTPKQVCSLMVEPAPAPLPLDEDGFSAAAGILEDDGIIRATYDSLEQERWNK